MDSNHIAPHVRGRQDILAYLATQLYFDINTKGILAQGVQVFNPPLESVACQVMDVAEWRRFAIRMHTIEVASTVEPHPIIYLPISTALNVVIPS